MAKQIEVVNGKGILANGTLLEFVRETSCFIWVKGEDGTHWQVSKKTNRINGTAFGFIRASRQPIIKINDAEGWEPAEDANAWMNADAELIAANRARQARRAA